jgi:hypothetical protein
MTTVMNKNLIGLIIGAVIVSLSAGSTIQSVSAQPGNITTNQGDFCQQVPQHCEKLLNWCHRHPEQCLEIVQIPNKIFKIPFPPKCPRCPEKVILTLNPGELFVVGQLNNNTVALSVSPQDVLNMLGNVTSMTNASATAK